MTDKLSPKRTANALAITAGIVSLICYILILVAPAGTVSFFGAIFHSIDLSKISTEPVSIWYGLLGIIEAIVLGWIIGWLFARIYNKVR